jgi:hypothetical protein
LRRCEVGGEFAKVVAGGVAVVGEGFAIEPVEVGGGFASGVSGATVKDGSVLFSQAEKMQT